MTDKKNIGKALQKIRKEQGFKSAKSFAEHMGYTVGTYTDWEQGHHLFSFAQAWEMADALECTLDELGGRTPPHSRETLTADESALVDVYRTLDATSQLATRQLADTLSPKTHAAKSQTRVA